MTTDAQLTRVIGDMDDESLDLFENEPRETLGSIFDEASPPTGTTSQTTTTTTQAPAPKTKTAPKQKQNPTSTAKGGAKGGAKGRKAAGKKAVESSDATIETPTQTKRGKKRKVTEVDGTEEVAEETPKTSKKTRAPAASNMPWRDDADKYMMWCLIKKARGSKPVFHDAEWKDVANDMGDPFDQNFKAVQQRFNKTIRPSEWRMVENFYVFKPPYGGPCACEKEKLKAEEEDEIKKEGVGKGEAEAEGEGTEENVDGSGNTLAGEGEDSD